MGHPSPVVFNKLLSGEFYVYTPCNPDRRYVTIRDKKEGWHALRIDADDETLEELQAAAEVLVDVVKIRYQEALAKWQPLLNE